jgi:hypothetical protein
MFETPLLPFAMTSSCVSEHERQSQPVGSREPSWVENVLPRRSEVAAYRGVSATRRSPGGTAALQPLGLTTRTSTEMMSNGARERPTNEIGYQYDAAMNARPVKTSDERAVI